MAESTSRWDTQGLGFGLAFGLLGLLFLMGRNDHSLRPVHVLGVIVLSAGAALLMSAIDRTFPDQDRPAERTSDSDFLELP